MSNNAICYDCAREDANYKESTTYYDYHLCPRCKKLVTSFEIPKRMSKHEIERLERELIAVVNGLRRKLINETETMGETAKRVHEIMETGKVDNQGNWKQ